MRNGVGFGGGVSVNVNSRVNRQGVRIRSEARDDPTTDRGDHRMVPEGFAGVNIREMDLNGGDPDRRNGVAQVDACVSIGRGVQDDHIKLAFGLLYPLDQLALEVGLAKPDVDSASLSETSYLRFDVRKRCSSVNLRLTLAQEIQIGTVQEQDAHSGEATYLAGPHLSRAFPGCVATP